MNKIEKYEFKIKILRRKNEDQKQLIENQDDELKLLNQELKMLKSRLNKIVNLAYIKDK